MDLSYGPEYEAVRHKVRRFLDERWPGDGSGLARDEATFQKLATSEGLLYRTIPREYGGGGQEPDALKARVIREEFEARGAPLERRSLGTELLVPTLLEFGTEWQKSTLIASTIAGEIVWCQGYSEPGSGSDLASLSTRAELDGDEWVINGQKVWTSDADRADYMFVLARTEPDAPKRRGLSYLLVPMKQPGIEVRPLRQITGGYEFNEVFFTDARTPADWIVGERGLGWQVANTTLKHERAWVGDASQSERLLKSLLRLAARSEVRGRRAIDDPGTRQRLAEIQGAVEAQRYSGYIQLSRAIHGGDPGVLTLLNKLSSTNIAASVSTVAVELLGDTGLLPHTGAGPESQVGAERWMFQFFGSLGAAIAGGSSNIQRNIIAERGLGLPRDPIVVRAEAVRTRRDDTAGGGV
jgi:alkylation response protein AidB-like acyl-CoA dehydrogenase